MWHKRAGNQHPQHYSQLFHEGVSRLHRRIGGFGAVDGHLDTARELLDGDAACELQSLRAADPRDRGRDLGCEPHRIGLVEVACLREMFGEQFLQMRRTFERCEQRAEPGADFGNKDIGKARAGRFRGLGCRGFRRQRLFIETLNPGPEQRLLGREVMIERLPRQPRLVRRLLDRRAAKAIAAEHAHGSVQNAVLGRLSGLHLSNLTNEAELSNHGLMTGLPLAECTGLSGLASRDGSHRAAVCSASSRRSITWRRS